MELGTAFHLALQANPGLLRVFLTTTYPQIIVPRANGTGIDHVLERSLMHDLVTRQGCDSGTSAVLEHWEHAQPRTKEDMNQGDI
jgi:hypothetical protein